LRADFLFADFLADFPEADFCEAVMSKACVPEAKSCGELQTCG